MKQLKIEIPFTCYTPAELPEKMDQLVEAAKKAALCAYAPYSHFQVGAAVLLENELIITGSNQENAAYPSGLCAERVALFSAGHQYPNVAIKALAIVALHKDAWVEQITPCGACRQVLLESEQRQQKPFEVLLCGSAAIYVASSAASLLPFAFDSDAFLSV